MEKHHAVIYGNIYEIKYKFGDQSDNYVCHYSFYTPSKPRVYSIRKVVKSEIIWEGEINNPLLEIHESIYIPEIVAKVVVTDRARIIDGGYMYETDYEIRTVEDENSREKAEKEREEYISLLKKEKEEVKVKIVSVPETEYKKKWYQFWK